MITVLCTLASGVAFYFSIALGEHWALAWIAPVPVLWLAYGKTPAWQAFLAAAATYAIGGANILPAYLGVLPAPALLLAIFGPALVFALAVSWSRLVFRRFGALAAMIAFGALWAGFDYLSAFNRAGGSIATPAAAEVGAPMLAQGAALFGFAAITFLLGAVAAGLAVALRERRPLPGLLAAALFVANAGFGFARLATPAGETMRVGLIASNDVTGPIRDADETRTLAAMNAYAAQILQRREQPTIIVLPENLARIGPEWRDAALAPLQRAAATRNVTIVAGANTALNGAQHNIAWMISPDGKVATYAKRRLVPGLETSKYAPGLAPLAPVNGVGVEICKDMDFAGMIRRDISTHGPRLLAVPAWDFGADRWAHARIAILRSIETGVPLARAARDGLLTLNDRYGRLVAKGQVGAGFTALVADVPLARNGQTTLYVHIGDVFAWLCLAIGLGLVAAARFPLSTPALTMKQKTAP